MPANDQNLFEDQKRVIHDDEIAAEFEEELVDDDGEISSNQQETLQAAKFIAYTKVHKRLEAIQEVLKA